MLANPLLESSGTLDRQRRAPYIAGRMRPRTAAPEQRPRMPLATRLPVGYMIVTLSGRHTDGSAPRMEVNMDRRTRLQRSASRSLLAVAGLNAVHILVALLSAPTERLTPLNIIPGILLNTVLIGLLVWTARGLMRGARIKTAIGVLTFLLIGLTIAVPMVLANGYDASVGLMIVQLLLAASVFGSFVLVFRLSLPSRQDDEKES